MPVATEDLTIEVIRLARVIHHILELLRKGGQHTPDYTVVTDLLARIEESIKYLERNSR